MDEAISRRRCSLARLSAVDLYLVHWFVQTARPRPVRSSAIALSWMGNGWIYLALSIGSIIAAGLDAIPVLVAGTANAWLLHCIYPLIKRFVARPRPYQRDATLVPLLRALDRALVPERPCDDLARSAWCRCAGVSTYNGPCARDLAADGVGAPGVGAPLSE